MMNDLNCTQFQATLGLSLYCLGFGVLPLLTSSLSEDFGRLPLYYVSVAGFLLMHVMTALYVPAVLGHVFLLRGY